MRPPRRTPDGKVRHSRTHWCLLIPLATSLIARPPRPVTCLPSAGHCQPTVPWRNRPRTYCRIGKSDSAGCQRGAVLGREKACGASGPERSRSAWWSFRSSSTRRPSSGTSRSARCTGRTAAGSSSAGSARSTAQEVPYSDVAKGYELATGDVVVLTDDDLKDLPLATAKRIDVLHFSPAGQLDPILANKAYYLEPEPAGVRAYVLFRDALERSGRVAVAKVAIRQREALAALRVRDGVLVLETLLWPDEVRAPDFKFLDEDVDIRTQELKMAASLIDTMTEDFDPSLYKDAYREALEALVQAKIEGNEVVRPAGTAIPAGLAGRARRPHRDAPRERRGGQGEPGQGRGRRCRRQRRARSSASLRRAAGRRARDEPRSRTGPAGWSPSPSGEQCLAGRRRPLRLHRREGTRALRARDVRCGHQLDRPDGRARARLRLRRALTCRAPGSPRRRRRAPATRSAPWRAR